MSGKDILHRFGFTVEEEPVSIYPFSPVYHVTQQGYDVIVKRTQKMAKARHLVDYTSYLHTNGVPIVTPVKLGKDNPQSINGETYIVYPFIDGTVYSGKKNEIFQAGKLLGRIHSLSPKENTYQLDEYDVYDFTKDEVIESVQSIKQHADRNFFSIDEAFVKNKLIQIVDHQDELKKSRLIHVLTPHDYKANNLIYTPNPYLIDPDNAAWLPRIFDLALVLLLFHNEHANAPSKMFTSGQWRTFLKGYFEYITLTEQEYNYWTKAVEHVFLDEVMWLMAEVEEDWERPSQRSLFASLIEVLTDCSEYGLV